MRAASLSLLLLGVVACGGDPGPYAELVAGEWQWLDTSGGTTGETRSNPAHRWRLRFSRDGTIREEYSGRPATAGTYHIESGADAEADDATLVLELSGEQLVMIQDAPFEVTTRADTLLLASAGQGFSYRFVRIGEP